MKSSFRYSLVPILLCELDLANPNLLLTCQFFHDFYAKSSSRCSLLHILPNSSSKSAWQFFVNFSVKSNSRYSPVHFLPTTFADRGPQPPKQRPYIGDRGSHFTRKNTGFCARESFQAWIHAFPISHTSQLITWWCGWHDDVVAMVRMLAMTTARNSEVF